MPKFLVTYHGPGEPAPAELPAARAAFGKWLASAGKAVTDPGSPVRFAAQVATGRPAEKVAIGGYSIIEADSPEAAIALLKTHPYVARGGTLQLSQQVTI